MGVHTGRRADTEYKTSTSLGRRIITFPVPDSAWHPMGIAQSPMRYGHCIVYVPRRRLLDSGYKNGLGNQD